MHLHAINVGNQVGADETHPVVNVVGVFISSELDISGPR